MTGPFALIVLALLMLAVTYPSRAIPLLAPGVERLPPRVLAYLRLVGPACLAALAATNSVVAGTGPARLEVGIAPLAVVLCAVVVAWRRSLLLGVVAAVVAVSLSRAAGIG